MNIQAKRKPVFKPLLKKICYTHRIKDLGYNGWHKWAEENEKRGIHQTQCPTCGYWLYPEEY